MPDLYKLEWSIFINHIFKWSWNYKLLCLFHHEAVTKGNFPGNDEVELCIELSEMCLDVTLGGVRGWHLESSKVRCHRLKAALKGTPFFLHFDSYLFPMIAHQITSCQNELVKVIFHEKPCRLDFLWVLIRFWQNRCPLIHSVYKPCVCLVTNGILQDLDIFQACLVTVHVHDF